MDFYNKAPSRQPSLVVDLLIAALVVLAAGMLLMSLGCSSKSDEEITAIAEQEAHDKKITFTFPLEYTATVTQCDMQRECRTRFYQPR